LGKESWTILQLIRWTSERFQKEKLPTPRLDAEVLLSSALGVDRVRLYTHFDKPLLPEELARFKELIRRRIKREPIAYIIGRREFWSLSFKVTRDVLIPRPDTEILVSEALTLTSSLPPEEGGLPILEIGTGSGAVGVALAKELASGLITATDISEAALAVAMENAAGHGVSGRLRFLHGDLFSPLKKGERFRLILTNPPYIPRAEMADLMPEVRDFEPALALDGGRDGLDFYRRIFRELSDFLLPGGWFLGEIGVGQDQKILGIAGQNPDLGEFSVVADLAGIKRVFKARKHSQVGRR
jgi:release factor glutamine methyltransferase